LKAQAYLIEGANARHEHGYALWETAFVTVFPRPDGFRLDLGRPDGIGN